MDGKQFGANLISIKCQMETRIKTNVPLSFIKKIIHVLLEESLVLSVGVVERVYVAHEFKQHWVIQSCKNQKGVCVSSINNAILDSSDCDFMEVTNNNKDFDSPEESVNISSGSEKRTVTRSKSQLFESSQSDTDLLSRKFKTVCLIPRPWRYIDGLLNRPVLKQMLITIILYLKTYPNSTFEMISSHFSPILQPIMTLELVEMLERLRCLTKIILKKETNCNLFSDFNNGSFKIDNEEDTRLNGDEIFNYYCSQNSIFTIKKVFPD